MNRSARDPHETGAKGDDRNRTGGTFRSSSPPSPDRLTDAQREAMERACELRPDRPRGDQTNRKGPMTSRNGFAAVLVVLFLAAVVAANLIVHKYGPTVTPYVAFGLVGMALVLRDRFADIVGPRRVLAQSALILAGAVLSYLVNRDAATIAIASCVAFAGSEAVEGTVYYAIRRRPWLERAPLSATCGAAVDSVLFISIAFGFSFAIAFAQFVAKVAGGYVWAWVIAQAKGTAEVPA